MFSPSLLALQAQMAGKIIRSALLVREIKRMKQRVDALEKIFAARYRPLLLENE